MKKTSDPVTEEYMAVTRDLVDRNRVITIVSDVFFVDVIPFLLIMAQRLKFVTVKHSPTCTPKSLTNHINRVLQVYVRAGFYIRYIMMEGEVEK